MIIKASRSDNIHGMIFIVIFKKDIQNDMKKVFVNQKLSLGFPNLMIGSFHGAAFPEIHCAPAFSPEVGGRESGAVNDAAGHLDRAYGCGFPCPQRTQPS